jgi:hypothetical protein
MTQIKYNLDKRVCWHKLTFTPAVVHVPMGAAVVQHIELITYTENDNNLDRKRG